jgi:Helix-turn-helix domain
VTVLYGDQDWSPPPEREDTVGRLRPASSIWLPDTGHFAALEHQRTFLRKFRASTDTTPYQWLLQQRILIARRLLERTDEPIDRIAHLCGFRSAGSLRMHFRQSVGVAPLTYRQMFGVSGFRCDPAMSPSLTAKIGSEP